MFGFGDNSGQDILWFTAAWFRQGLQNSERKHALRYKR